MRLGGLRGLIMDSEMNYDKMNQDTTVDVANECNKTDWSLFLSFVDR